MNLPATGIPILDWFLALLGSYGYLITFAATVLENLFVIGSITPGETVVMAAAFVSVQSPTMNPAAVWVFSVIGTVTGSNVSYLLGRRGGRPALLRYGHRFHISEERIRAAEEYFDVHGSKTVLLSRFAAGIKNFVPMIAGISHMRLLVFEAYVLLGAVIYTTVMVAIGVLLGENFQRALGVAARLGYAGFAVFVFVIAAAVIARKRYVARRLREAAEVAERAAEEVADAARALGHRGDGEGGPDGGGERAEEGGRPDDAARRGSGRGRGDGT